MPTIGLGKLYRCENCGATLTEKGIYKDMTIGGASGSSCCWAPVTEMTGRIQTCHTCRRPYGEDEAQPIEPDGFVSPCCGN